MNKLSVCICLIFYVSILLSISVTNNSLLAQDFSDKYDEVGEFQEGWTTVRKGDKWGVINEEGIVIAPIQYESIRVVGLDCDVMGLLINGDYCFVDSTRIRCYNQLKPFDKTGKARVYNNGLWGFINKKGQEILPVKYSFIEYFHDDGLTIVSKKDGTKGVINHNLDFVIPSIYTRINRLHPKYFRVYSASSKSYGLIDKKGKIVLPMEYKDIRSIHNTNFIFVRKAVMLDERRSKNEDQFFDPQSQKLSPKIYEKLRRLTDGPDFLLNPQFIAKKDGKYGLIGGEEEIIIPFEYDLLRSKGSKLKATKDKKVGFLDFKGNVIVPIVYDRELPMKNKQGFFNHQKLLATCSKNGKYGVIDTAYQVIIPFKYDNIKILSKNEIIARKRKKAGLINHKREVIIPFEYTNIKRSGLKKSYIVSQLEGNNWRTALMDSTRNMIIPFERNYQSIDDFDNGKASIQHNNKYGFIDSTGKEVIPAIYDEKIEEWYTLMIIKKNGKVGIIDSTGQIFIEPIYDRIFKSLDRKIGTLFYVYKNNKMGIIKQDKTILIPLNKYDKILSLKHLKRYYISKATGFSNKYMIIVKDDKKGLINHKGEEILPPILDYDHISTFDKNDFAIVNKGGKTSCMCSTCRLVGGKWGIINIKGEEVLPLEYDRITGTNNAYRLTKDTTFYAYYPPKNNLSDAYNEIGYHFVQNIIMAKKGEKWAVFHKTKGEVLPPQFDNVKYKQTKNRQDAKSKAILVEKNGKWGVINAITGELVATPKYSSIKFVSDNLLAYNIGKTVDICLEKEPENGLWGLLDLTGKEITPAKYNIIGDFSEGLVFVNIGGKTKRGFQGVIGFGGGGKWGAIDSTGKIIIPLIYCNHYPSTFQNGYVALLDCSKQKSNKIILDTKGVSIFAEKYDRFNYISGFRSDIITAQKGDKWRLLHLKKGKPINDKWYDKFFGIRKNIATATRDGQKYKIDINGQEQEVVEESK